LVVILFSPHSLLPSYTYTVAALKKVSLSRTFWGRGLWRGDTGAPASLRVVHGGERVLVTDLLGPGVEGLLAGDELEAVLPAAPARLRRPATVSGADRRARLCRGGRPVSASASPPRRRPARLCRPVSASPLQPAASLCRPTSVGRSASSACHRRDLLPTRS
jgi:hypothetical protein